MEILSQMEVKDITKILGKMDNQKAAKITSSIRLVAPNRLPSTTPSNPQGNGEAQDGASSTEEKQETDNPQDTTLEAP